MRTLKNRRWLCSLLVAFAAWTAAVPGSASAAPLDRLQVGMTAGQVRGVLGEPGGVLPLDGGSIWLYALPRGRGTSVPLYLLFVGQPAQLLMWEADANGTTAAAAEPPAESAYEQCKRRYPYFEDRLIYCRGLGGR